MLTLFAVLGMSGGWSRGKDTELASLRHDDSPPCGGLRLHWLGGDTQIHITHVCCCVLEPHRIQGAEFFLQASPSM